jgi:hypothetical protein
MTYRVAKGLSMIERNICALLLLVPSVLWGMEEGTQGLRTDTMRMLEKLERLAQDRFEQYLWNAVHKEDISEKEIGRVKKDDQKDLAYYEAPLSSGGILYASQCLSGEHKGEIDCKRYFEYHGADGFYNESVPVDHHYFFVLKNLFEQSEKSRMSC